MVSGTTAAAAAAATDGTDSASEICDYILCLCETKGKITILSAPRVSLDAAI